MKLIIFDLDGVLIDSKDIHHSALNKAIELFDKNYIISAKSGETTNVVKPGDILDLLAKNSKAENKWKNTKEYNVLKTLSDNSIDLVLTDPPFNVGIDYDEEVYDDNKITHLQKIHINTKTAIVQP